MLASSAVLGCLAYGHGRTVGAIVERLGKARVIVAEVDVETALVELLDQGLVEEVGRGLWQRV